MHMVEVREKRVALEAAAWYQRLEEGLSAAEVPHYLRWLTASLANVEAMLFLEQFCNSLERKGCTRH
jgi:ferric-dicitrate binding protein FerR (iron transport regulator)